MVHTVVDGGPPAAGLHGQMPIGRFADAGVDQHLDRGRTGLPEVDRDGAVLLVNRGDVGVGVLHGFILWALWAAGRLPRRRPDRLARRCAS
ncbi:hypothetical protein ACFFX0_13050 [Citricoccus parietis]|uniref:Uncharacterized protein n=1 Tax=Citricoccus parietis TaxID=592307 RepID=A0ABV5FZG4_9MICC